MVKCRIPALVTDIPPAPAGPRMHLDTHSFRKSQRADTSLKCTGADNLQGGQRDAVPDPNVRLQRLTSLKIGIIRY